MTRSRLRSSIARLGRAIWATIRRYFATGLLAFAPIAVTLWAMAWIVNRLDNLLLPKVIAVFVPGLEGPIESPPLVGALFTFLVILLAGVAVRHLFGNEVVRVSERLLNRVPVARSIYSAVKQLVEAIFGQQRRHSFNRVVLIEYPRRGLYALAFTTGAAEGPVADAIGEPMVNCFVPTTPNPTSGFYLLVKRDEVSEVHISVEEAFKVVMSAGLVTPETQRVAAPPELVTAAHNAAADAS